MKSKGMLITGILLIGFVIFSGCIKETKEIPSETPVTKIPTSTPPVEKNSEISGSGTVRLLDFEGGFYGIISDNGEKYDPINLNKEFQVDGLRVRFDAKKRENMVSYHMWGTIIEIINIERIEK
jgi:hypothetical protein